MGMTDAQYRKVIEELKRGRQQEDAEDAAREDIARMIAKSERMTHDLFCSQIQERLVSAAVGDDVRARAETLLDRFRRLEPHRTSSGPTLHALSAIFKDLRATPHDRRDAALIDSIVTRITAEVGRA